MSIAYKPGPKLPSNRRVFNGVYRVGDIVKNPAGVIRRINQVRGGVILWSTCLKGKCSIKSMVKWER